MRRIISLLARIAQSEAARTVAVNITAVLADVAAQLLALLRRHPLATMLVFMALQLAALQFLLAPEFTLLLGIALLDSLEAARTLAGLGLGGQACRQSGEDACEDSKAFHGFHSCPSRCPLLDRSKTPVGVMPFLINVPTGGIQVLLQIPALAPGQHAIRLVLPLLDADILLFGTQIP